MELKKEKDTPKKEEDSSSDDDKKKKRKKKKEKKENSQINNNKNEINITDSKRVRYNIINDFENKITQIIDEATKEKEDEIKFPKFLKNVLEHLKNNLKEFDFSFSEGIFGDFTSIFKTGIIPEKIFNQSPLIAENFTYMPTTVIERCNDLFNYSPKITLSEDTCNTFTKDDKLLKGFADSFRVIATSSELAIRNLSDAAQSRFSVFYTTSYTLEERDLLIQMLYNDTPKKFFDFLKEYNIKFRTELSFLYITKILNILKLIDEKYGKYERENEEIRDKFMFSYSFISKIFNG